MAEQRQVAGRRGLLDLRSRQLRILTQIQPRRPLFEAAQQQVLDGVERDRSQLEGLPCGGSDLFAGEVFEQAQNLHVLAFARLAQPRLEQAPQTHQLFGQLPAFERRRLIERVRLALQQGQVVDGIEDQLFALVAASMPGDPLGAATDDHVIDVGFHQHLAMAVARRNRVVVGLIARQRQRAHPRRSFVASLVRRRRQR